MLREEEGLPPLISRLGVILRAGFTLVSRGGLVQFYCVRSDANSEVATVIDVKTGSARDGSTERADCTIRISEEDLVAVADGRLDRLDAVMTGRMSVDGAAWLAFTLVELISAVSSSLASPTGVAKVLRLTIGLSKRGGTVQHELPSGRAFYVDCTAGRVRSGYYHKPPSATIQLRREEDLEMIASGRLDRERPHPSPSPSP